jgi:hypothetical protein
VVARIERRLVTLIAACAIGAYCWIYTRPGAYDPIHSDGYNHYVYAASWLVYHDASLDALSNDWYGGAYPNFVNMQRWPDTGHWLNRMPIGVSILILPFVAAADLLTRWSNFPRDGLSFFYQHGAGIAGVFYGLLGLCVLRSMLRRHYRPAVTAATLLVLTFGTDLFHYMVFDGTFSHVYSFALVAVLVDLTDRWWSASAWWHAPVLGVVAALIVLVRHPNAVLLLIVPLWQLERFSDLWQRRRDLLRMTAAGALCVAPQAIYYRWASGHWLANAYALTGAHFTFLAPHLFGVFVSTQRGLFFWAPALLLAVAGAFVTRGWARGRLPAVAFVLAVNAWMIASWSDWEYGASFGHRAFVDSFALMGILLASFFDWISSRTRLAWAAGAVTSAATLLTVTQMIQYWMLIWPPRDITWERYRSLFLTFR